MLKTLGLHAIGLPGRSIPEAIEMASRHGFDAITFDIREASALADEHGAGSVRDFFSAKQVVPGSWNLPAAIRDPEQFETDLKALPKLAALGVELGCNRVTTGVGPGSNDRTYDENFAWHAERLRRAAEPLAAAGCWIGIEFIGPKTLRAPYAHEFIYTMRGIQELGRAIGTGNIGVLLDIWHLYTSGGSIADIDLLTVDEIVAVHVNDAPPGIPRDEQIDNARALPMETGVLESAPFMQKLQALGFAGPVMPEPFSSRIDALAAQDPNAAVRETAESMNALWRAAGLEAGS